MAANSSDRRHKVDTAGLTMAVIFLVVAAIGLVGGTWWITVGALPWAIAGVVALVGVAMVLSSLPRRGR